MKLLNPTMSRSLPRLAFHREGHPGAVILWADPGDAFERLKVLLADRDLFRHFPTEGWRMAYDQLRCPRCGETNTPKRKPMVEKDERGVIFCASCGTESK